MSHVAFTDEQRQAIETIDRGVTVSAAAGSGKTAVLAARCAYLVADAPPPYRSDVDQLLVLTFTDAAAAEMRARIVESLRAGAATRPDDERLREQSALVDSAQISTIHSFCLWMCRRWFNELGIDPQAPLLDEEEGRLLRREVLDELFDRLYDRERDPVQLLLESSAGAEAERTAGEGISSRENGGADEERSALSAEFIRLVDDYGLGDDRDIGHLVLRLHDYTASLPAPEHWLREAQDVTTNRAEETILALGYGLSAELTRQIVHVSVTRGWCAALPQPARAYAAPVLTYLEDLRAWSQDLQAALPPLDGADGLPAAGVRDALRAFDDVAASIQRYEFPRAPSIRLPKDSAEELRAARDEAKKRFDHLREFLFKKRLRSTFAAQTTADWRKGLQRIAPYVQTLVELVRQYGLAYDDRKRRLDVLDFSDLERMALQLLTVEGDPSLPSEIARSLRQRFVHVLVDEFQDINPIQHAIVQLVSRPAQQAVPDNLFVVGDIKQSIYRFRLAEPEIFAGIVDAARRRGPEKCAVALQNNFRSRPEIVNTVNRLFRGIMAPGCGDIAYDAAAELKHGRSDDAEELAVPAELHVLERRVAGASGHGDSRLDSSDDPPGGNGAEEGSSTLADSARWSVPEREAYLIGTRIRELIAAQTLRPGGESLRYGHCVILLRAARVAAESMSWMLHALGIPAHAEAGASLLESREVRDTLAALHVLDNEQQDIPLAAVLRSGIFGEAFSADELVEIRALDRDLAFHACFRAYAEHGANAALRERLFVLRQRIAAYRHDIRCRPLAETLWDLYERHGFLAQMLALPGGLQRRSNLFKLHELAGRFGTFRRQGLHRFLRFIESLQEQDHDLAPASPLGPSEDVVRIISIHQSKGLEFPVVFVAGLGNQFNLRDRSGRIIFERRAKIGMRVVEPGRRVEYPSATHQLAAGEIERRSRDEEMRVLYVAMTRARDQLVLVGSRAYLASALADWTAGAVRPMTPLEITSASSALDWIGPIWGGQTNRSATASVGEGRATDVVRLATYTGEQIATWRISPPATTRERSVLDIVSQVQPLPPDEPVCWEDAQVDRLFRRLDFTYPSLALTSIRSAQGASEFKGDAAVDLDSEALVGTHRSESRTRPPDSLRGLSIDQETAVQRGLVMHRVLQQLDFQRATDAYGVETELQRLLGQHRLSQEELVLVDREALVWFVQTPLAQQIRAAGDGFRREFPFIARESPNLFDRTMAEAAAPDDYVLVRGIIDGILVSADAIEIVDYKTDAVAGSQVDQRVDRYRPQVTLYARAAERLWKKPVRSCRLVFLTPRQIVAVTDFTSIPDSAAN